MKPGLSHVETVTCSEGERMSGWLTPESAGQSGWSGLLRTQQLPACGGNKFQNVTLYKHKLTSN